MATSVTITGTGCPIPDAERAGPGAMVRYVDDDKLIGASYQGDIEVANDLYTCAVGTGGLPQTKQFVPVAERD